MSHLCRSFSVKNPTNSWFDGPHFAQNANFAWGLDVQVRQIYWYPRSSSTKLLISKKEWIHLPLIQWQTHWYSLLDLIVIGQSFEAFCSLIFSPNRWRAWLRPSHDQIEKSIIFNLGQSRVEASVEAHKQLRKDSRIAKRTSPNFLGVCARDVWNHADIKEYVHTCNELVWINMN